MSNIHRIYSTTSRIEELTHALTTTDDPELIAEWQLEAEALGAQMEEHLDNILGYRDGMLQTVAGLDAEIERLEALKLERELRSERIEQQVAMWLLSTGQTKLMLPLHTINVRPSAGKVKYNDTDAIPTEYLREIPATTKPDGKAILEALRNGIPVAGCELDKSHISITIK